MKAREFAHKALYSIMIDHSYSNLYLRQHLDEVEENDRALSTQLVYGTLQNALYVRSIWEPFVDKLPSKRIRILLDMSVFQLEFLSAPSYAVLQESVELTKKIEPSSTKFVNAILRNVTRREKVDYDETLESVAITTSHPLWIVRMWAKQYGEQIAIQICKSNMMEKPLSVRVDTNKISMDELIATGNYVKGELSPVCLHYVGKQLFQQEEFLSGKVIVQDEASQMVALALDVKDGMKVFDACSAPGTKTSQIAQLMNNVGHIDAFELHEHRVELVKQLMNKLEISIVDVKQGDSTQTLLADNTYDRVLCDVPCSGYGVLSRKSDIKYHMQSEDMDSLLPVQYNILKEGIRILKPGGILVYSTCTINKKENEKQIERAINEIEGISLESEKTLFPFSYNSDGFYIAVLRKNS